MAYRMKEPRKIRAAKEKFGRLVHFVNINKRCNRIGDEVKYHPALCGHPPNWKWGWGFIQNMVMNARTCERCRERLLPEEAADMAAEATHGS